MTAWRERLRRFLDGDRRPGEAEGPAATAHVVFDSETDARAGLRGPATVPDRHVVLRAGDVDVALDLHAEGDEREVDGQVLVAEEQLPATVRLLDAGSPTPRCTVVTDDYGSFGLPGVPPGSYLLEVVTAGTTVRAAVDLP